MPANTWTWQRTVSIFISLAIVGLAYWNRAWLIEAFGLLREGRPLWLIAALVIILLGYLISSQVIRVMLRSLGFPFGIFRVWMLAVVAIVISQSVPAGGVGSYAFLVSSFNRRGVPPGKATLVASLETLSYVIAMVCTFGFSVIYLATRDLFTGESSYLAAATGILLISAAVFVLTRSEETLQRWLLTLKNGVAWLLRRQWGDAWVLGIVAELHLGRQLIASRRRDVILLVMIQITGLSAHALAMLSVLYGLGAHTNFAVVMVAFGIALVTSTFNVLPGGGGTVEAALVAVLTQLDVGPAAVPAAIIFRLLNFWLIAPVAALGYTWLTHEAPVVNEVRE